MLGNSFKLTKINQIRDGTSCSFDIMRSMGERVTTYIRRSLIVISISYITRIREQLVYAVILI